MGLEPSRGIVGESEGGGHGELSSPKQEGGPIPRTLISVFQKHNGNKVSNWVVEQGNAHKTLTTITTPFSWFLFRNLYQYKINDLRNIYQNTIPFGCNRVFLFC